MVAMCLNSASALHGKRKRHAEQHQVDNKVTNDFVSKLLDITCEILYVREVNSDVLYVDVTALTYSDSTGRLFNGCLSLVVTMSGAPSEASESNSSRTCSPDNAGWYRREALSEISRLRTELSAAEVSVMTQSHRFNCIS